MRQSVRDVIAYIVRHTAMRGRTRLVSLIAGDAKKPTPVVARIPRVGLMELDLSSYLEREVFVTGTHGDEKVVTKRIIEHLHLEGAVFVDVGANVGLHTVPVGRHLAKIGGRVVAFEPIQANYDRLLTNIKLNHLANVQVEQLGLADREETIEVCRSTRGSCNFSLASTGDFREQVQLVRFDDWVVRSTLQRVDVLKMDIEGAEVRAIRGMLESIERFRPVLIVEINPMWTRRMGTSTSELIHTLHKLGYTLLDCAESNTAPPQSRVVAYVDPQGTLEVNVVGIPMLRTGN